MALTNPKIFGLNIKSELSDVKNKNTALINLGINPLDLEIIKGSANKGMTRYDWFSFSRLKTPIYKTLTRFSGEASIFNSILTNRAGTDQTLFGNLDINGSLSGSAIRYRFLEGSNNGRLADISTSRVSAWSSSDPRANNQILSTQKKARISYGARVSVVSGGQLQFGEQSTATQALGNDTSNVAVQRDSDNNIIPGPAGQPRLQTTLVPEEKEFASEVPTSKIKCKIGTETVFLYAMKGIPLVFKGFFRNLNARVNINYTAGGSIPASWKIVETGNASRYTNFANRGTGSSSIAFRSPVSRERFIKFYYNPKHITQVQIRSANIRELPATRLENCTELDFAYNKLKLFPNVSFVAPKIDTLSLMENPFYLSDNEFERKFNNLIMDKIKTPNNTLRTLNMHGTFYGSIERHLIPVNLPNLTSLNLGRGSGAYFHSDDKPDSGLTNNSGSDSFCPDIPASVTSYKIVNNRFSSVDLNEITSSSVQVAKTDPLDGSLSVSTESLSNGSYSFKKAPNLTSLNVTNNQGLSDAKSSGNFDLASKDKLVTVHYSGTGLGIANMQNSPSLKTYSQTYATGGAANPLVSGTGYRFENCSALESLSFYATNLGAINFPTNFSNPNLITLDLRYTNIKGGTPGIADASQTEVISSGTFFTSPSIQNIYIDSPNLLAKPINVDAFKQNPDLGYFWFRSHGRVDGDLPDFSANPLLHHLWLENNNFTGSLPNFGNNQNIHYVNVTRNNFTNTIPAFTNLSNLRYLFLQNNSFTGIGEPNNLPNLYYYYAHNNQLRGEIPDFTTCTNLRYLTLYNNQLSAYKVGSFKSLYRIRYFDLSNNNLNQTTQDNIIFDLYDNWNAIKRGGVTVNLRGNKNNVGTNEVPSDEAKEKALILVQNGWNISVNGGLS